MPKKALKCAAQATSNSANALGFKWAAIDERPHGGSQPLPNLTLDVDLEGRK